MPYDLQLWCEDCQASYEGDCVLHGPLTRVIDTEVDTRARRSIPSILQLKTVNEFTGVFARKKLNKRLQFGPVVAVKVLDGTEKAKEAETQIVHRGGLALWVTNESGEKFLLDTRQEECSNWMCFVRAAQNKAQQNVVAFQYKGEIFFVTIKEISADAELLVWYSKDYAGRMGATLLLEERSTFKFRARERFQCLKCEIIFSSADSLENHLCSESTRTASAVTFSSSVIGVKTIVTSLSSRKLHVKEPVSVTKSVSRKAGAGEQTKPIVALTTASEVASFVPRGHRRSERSVEKFRRKGSTESLFRGTSERTAFKGKRVTRGGDRKGSGLRVFERKPIRSSHVRQKSTIASSVSVTEVSSHEEATLGSEEAICVQDVPRSEEEEKIRDLTKEETVASEIRAQVLQSVHSLSTSHGSLALTQSQCLVGEISAPSVVSSSTHSGVDVKVAAPSKILEAESDKDASVEEVGTSAKEPCRVELSPVKILEEPAPLKELEVVSGYKLHEGEEGIRARTESEEESVSIFLTESLVTEESQELCPVCCEPEPHVCAGRVFACQHCSKSFTSRFKLSRHQLIHGGERQYCCNICNRSFHRKDHLKNHQQIHKPTKQYKCNRPNCGKEYNSFMSYRKHCAFHSAEEGDLQCKFCDKMFENKNDLIYHLKVHVGTRSVKNPSEKKFQCDQCDRRFFTRKDVKRHLVVHTGTRDFCCSLCPHKFGRKDHLVRHIKNSHGVTDMSRLETLADPLAVPGPSGLQHPVAPMSPGLSSMSTSSGETTGLSFVMSISPAHQPSLPPSSPASSIDPTMPSLPAFTDVETSAFPGFVSDPSDLRMLVSSDPIKEEPDLTASVASFVPDLSKMLGLYLPSSEGINMASLMEAAPPSLPSVVSTQEQLHQLQQAPLEEVAEQAVLLVPPPGYFTTQALSPGESLSVTEASLVLHAAASSPRTALRLSHLSEEEDSESHRLLSPEEVAPVVTTATTTPPSTATTTVPTTSSASMAQSPSHFLPGFDQTFQ